MLDRYSEFIAHFIGQFDQITEQSLYRLQYDAFRAQKAAADEDGALRHIEVKVSSGLALDSFSPDRVDVGVAPAAPAPQAEIARMPWLEGNAPNLLSANGVELVLHHGLPGTYFFTIPSGPPIFDLGAPGSLEISAVQINALQDNDILLYRPLDLDPDLAASRTEAALDAGFLHLATAADALTPVKPMLSDDGSTVTAESIAAFADAFSDLDTGAMPEGAEVTMVSQNEGTLPETGLLVDGVAAETAPDDLEALLAERDLVPSKDDDAEDDGETNEGATVTGETIEGSVDNGSLADDGAPQVIETGDNILMNQTSVNFGLVDAPVIAVAGVVQSFIAITQVNVLADRDTVETDAAADRGKSDEAHDARGSHGHNIASVGQHNASWKNDDPDGDVTPLGFAVTAIEGDLVMKSHVFQFNLICDNDVVTFETGWTEVMIGTGGNTAVDLMQILGFQTGFDMILVGGDMLTCVSIAQTNVLFDNDCVVGAPGIGGGVSTNDNLIWNQAEVGLYGIDSEAEMSDASATALDGLAAGRFDAGALSEEALLTGKEVPLLLTVGGNLVFEYHLEQFNLLTDADTLQMFIAAAAEQGIHPVDVSTGGNVLANLASLNLTGTDSTVMASGGVYSDVVIYQAGMYDTDETPLELGPFGPALASEAVAFLAEGMIDGHSGGGDGGGDVIIGGGGSSASLDALDSVLT